MENHKPDTSENCREGGRLRLYAHFLALFLSIIFIGISLYCPIRPRVADFLFWTGLGIYVLITVVPTLLTRRRKARKAVADANGK